MNFFSRTNWDELAHEERGHVFPTYLYWRSVQLACKIIDCSPGLFGVWYKDDGFSWMTTKGALANPGKQILARLEKDEAFLNKIVDANLIGVPKMLAASEWFAQDLSEKKGDELYRRWQVFYADFMDMMQYSIFGTVMEFEEPILSDKLLKILVEKVGGQKAGQYFSELTLLTEITVAQKEQLEMMALEERNLEQHWKKYAWIAFNYDGPGWTFEEMKKRFAKRHELKEVDMVARKKRQEEIEEKLGLSDHEKYLFRTLRTLGFWKFERKLMNGKSHYMLQNLFEEIAKRHDISLEDAKSILPSEMKTGLVDEVLDKKILKLRRRSSIAVYKGYETYELFTGKEAFQLEKDIEASLKVDTNVSEIRGSTAYKGTAKGRVRIVNTPADMEGFVGDILVSKSTSPEIITAMKNAAAIVTDSGGITCHAAIVARELKVPTIIGTKFATKILQQDELVEVDADKGVVTLLDKKK